MGWGRGVGRVRDGASAPEHRFRAHGWRQQGRRTGSGERKWQLGGNRCPLAPALPPCSVGGGAQGGGHAAAGGGCSPRARVWRGTGARCWRLPCQQAATTVLVLHLVAAPTRTLALSSCRCHRLPQDVEGCFVGNDLYVVQTRPQP